MNSSKSNVRFFFLFFLFSSYPSFRMELAHIEAGASRGPVSSVRLSFIIRSRLQPFSVIYSSSFAPTEQSCSFNYQKNLSPGYTF